MRYIRSVRNTHPCHVCLAVLVASMGTVSACSSKSSGGSGPQTSFDSGAFDVGFGEDSSTPADDAATPMDGTAAEAAAMTCLDAGVQSDGACNALAQAQTTPVTGACQTGAQPAGTGGTIADGTYVLTAQARYLDAGCTVGMYEATIEIVGACFQRVDTIGNAETRRSGTMTTSGNVITRTITCGPNLPAATYTATATQLTIFDAGGAVTTWTKQ